MRLFSLSGGCLEEHAAASFCIVRDCCLPERMTTMISTTSAEDTKTIEGDDAKPKEKPPRVSWWTIASSSSCSSSPSSFPGSEGYCHLCEADDPLLPRPSVPYCWDDKRTRLLSPWFLLPPIAMVVTRWQRNRATVFLSLIATMIRSDSRKIG